jgi:hypothetical protein
MTQNEQLNHWIQTNTAPNYIRKMGNWNTKIVIIKCKERIKMYIIIRRFKHYKLTMSPEDIPWSLQVLFPSAYIRVSA